MPFPVILAASAFLNTIGICGSATHQAALQMRFLGIHHLRTGTTVSSDILSAGALGAKVDVILPWFDGQINDATIAAMLTNVYDPARVVIEAVEGPDEVNDDPDIFDGLSGPAGSEAEQASIYAHVKADPHLETTSVFDFSVLQGTKVGLYSGMYPYVDYGNVHAYGGPGVPPIWVFPYELSNNDIAGTRPIVLTETGAETMPKNGVDQAMQARFEIEALLDAYNLGVPRTYLYNLQDWATGANINNFSAYYGLYDTKGVIKLAGMAIHNLTTIIAPDAAAAAFPITVTGMAYYGLSSTMQGSGKSYVLLWNETTEWDPTTNSEVAIPTDQVTLTLASPASVFKVYDPLVSAKPITTFVNSAYVTVGLNKDPLVIEIDP
jgi:hypothetical protein